MDDDRFRTVFSGGGEELVGEIQAVFWVLVGAVPFAKLIKLGAVPCVSNAHDNDLLFSGCVLLAVEDNCEVFDKADAGSSSMRGRPASFGLSKLDKDQAVFVKASVTVLAMVREGSSGFASEPSKLKPFHFPLPFHLPLLLPLPLPYFPFPYLPLPLP